MKRLFRTILCILCIMSLAGCSFVEDKGDYMPYTCGIGWSMYDNSGICGDSE